MKKLFKALSIILSLAVVLGILFQATVVNAATKKTTVRTITIGTGNAFKPYCYLDEKGQLQGYEKEVLTAVFKKLPQYKIKFKTSEFKNILLSLGSKKIDLAAHQFEVNPERKAKFLYGDESYTTFILRIVVKKDNTTTKGIADLAGKNVQVSPGSNEAYVLEQYNKDHADKALKLIYSSADQATTVKNLQDGKIDAFISITRIVQALNKTFGDVIKTVGDPIASSNTYFIFRKEDKQLKADVDKVLKELRKDGTLSKISIQILGGDYTTND
jgi:L-cystine transport system substrate-binding protein